VARCQPTGAGEGYLNAGFAVVDDSEQVVQHLDRLGLALVVKRRASGHQTATMFLVRYTWPTISRVVEVRPWLVWEAAAFSKKPIAF
jgi:hypothetical protein